MIKTMNRFKPISGLLLISLLSVTSNAMADQKAVTLLNRMNHALHELSYVGTLAYVRGDSLSTLKINHTVVNGVETETVFRLNEAGSKVSRELKGFSLASIPKISSRMKNVYSFDVGRTNRIAGLSCVIITARPKDRARYLQKYCINEQTGMLLDYVQVGKTHKPVERFMFTTIDIASPNKTSQIEKSLASSNVKTTVVVAHKATNLTRSENQLTLPDLDDGWVINQLPKGFRIRRAPNTHNKKGTGRHYIISDGLSSLSVFLSPHTKNDPANKVVVNSGALNVLSQKKQNFLVTVVGEVPVGTLKNILNNIRRK